MNTDIDWLDIVTNLETLLHSAQQALAALHADMEFRRSTIPAEYVLDLTITEPATPASRTRRTVDVERAHRRWQASEDRHLTYLWLQHKSCEEIGIEIGRSRRSVEERLQILRSRGIDLPDRSGKKDTLKWS